MAETHEIQIALDGVVRLLSQNLYADPDVFLREMIQNAQDSLVKRRLREPGHVGRIAIDGHAATATLTIEDDGIGLTRADIHSYLSTIGRSGTGELKERLRHGDPGEAAALIGQFGIGLLSAFMVAEKVELHTRHPDDDAWRWSFDGGTRYELAPGDREAVGTTVTLSLKREHTGYAAQGRLSELVRRYAELVPVPIHVDGASMPANAVRAPWDEERIDRGAAERFLARRFPSDEVLSWLVLDEPIGGGRLHGLLAITDRPAELGRARIALYVSRMFVTDQQAELLPSWAAFVRGVIECDALVPVAARDRVLVDETLRAAARAIERAVLDHLRALAQRDRATLVAILRIHAAAAMGLALDDGNEALFVELAPLIPLRTAMGPLTIAEAVAANRDGTRLRYTTRRQPSAAVQTLCEAQGLVLLDLGEAYAERFVQRFAQLWPDRLQPLRADEVGTGELLTPLPLAERMAWRKLEVVAQSLAGSDRIELARFEPAELPALRLDTAKGRSQRELRGVVEQLGVPAFLQDALAGALAQPTEGGVVYLNVAHPVLANLAEPALAEPRARAVLRVVLDVAALVSDAPLDGRARLAVLRGIASALQELTR